MTHRLNALDRGDGVPLVALHGFPVDHELMSGCLEPVLSARGGIRRLYPDLPGLGRSPGDGVSSTDDVLARVEEFLDEAIGDAPFLLVGESFGGYLARAIANRRRDRVLGLALICPMGTAVESHDRRVPPLEVRRSDPELVAGLDPAEAADFTEIAVVQSPETWRRFRAEIAPGLSRADQAAVARIRSAYALTSPPESDGPLLAPTLIVTGRQDNVTGYLDQWDLLEHYPHASFAVLDVAGHNLQIERPTLLDALLVDWLDRVDGESRT
ncbi:alpha/beta hydrolase [Agromyces sp. G08B096]|uniref:Alpha/beta hydrolase n=1 Tax=Agromyces sp. G08B096 TaxID=3156399 RepID=A0AAU7WC52_9MICO